MNGLTTEQAVQNLDNLIAASRMNRQEHVGMQQSLNLLSDKAMLIDKQGADKEERRAASEAKDLAEDTAEKEVD